jgi:DNA modification methylase
MRQLASESVDLIYLDPPFFSNRNYEVIWGDKGEIRSFEDRWAGGIEHYIAWLKERVQEMYRLLKPTGSIFLHCDWHANAYIRVFILDKIFGEKNFRNEVVWHYKSFHGNVKTYFAKKHDTIFFYTKSDRWTFHRLFDDDNEGTIDFERWNSYLVDGVKILGSNMPMQDSRFMRFYRRWVKENKRLPEAADVVYEVVGQALDTVWDIKSVDPKSSDRIGYPTQKPENLIEVILRAVTNEGDLVLDPFVGGGTTVVVADRLKRQWIGIDQSVQAVKVTEMRLYKQQDLFSAPFVVKLHKYDYDTLRYKDAFDFETWIVQQYGGTSNTKQRGDYGIDGRTREGVPIQVKRSDNIGRNVIDNFRSACERFDESLFQRNKEAGQAVGVLIAFSFGKGAIEEIARLNLQQNLVIRLVRVDDIVPIAKKPKLTVALKDLGADEKGYREIEFTATGESEAGIEMYAWDWDYDEGSKLFKPEVLRDTTGIQKRKFKPGAYVIAVRVVDNDGLEADEVIRLKVNGEIKVE